MLHEIEVSQLQEDHYKYSGGCYKSEFNSSYNKLGQSPESSFRQGKAPRYHEKRFGKDVEAEVMQKIIPEFTRKR
jgi:FKBP-type peptidyl-prolyl cis-trans isomerase (trigger factor)